MKHKLVIEMIVEHNGSCEMRELADMFELELEQHNPVLLTEGPDDFGATSYKVESISIEAVEN